MIYFIGSEEHSYAKIGYTEKLARRLTKMQADSPFKLIIYRLIDGTRDLERQLHKRFQHLRVRGEWYLRTEELLSATDFHVDSMPLLIKEAIVTKGIFPVKELIKKEYPNMNWSLFRSYSTLIRELALTSFGTTSYPTYLKLLAIYKKKKEGLAEHKACKDLGISKANWYTLKNKFEKFELFCSVNGVFDK